MLHLHVHKNPLKFQAHQRETWTYIHIWFSFLNSIVHVLFSVFYKRIQWIKIQVTKKSSDKVAICKRKNKKKKTLLRTYLAVIYNHLHIIISLKGVLEFKYGEIMKFMHNKFIKPFAFFKFKNYTLIVHRYFNIP